MSERNKKENGSSDGKKRGRLGQKERIQDEFFALLHCGKLATLDLEAWAAERGIHYKTAQMYFRQTFGASLENYQKRLQRKERQISDLPPEITAPIVNLALHLWQSGEYRYLELLNKYCDEKCAGLLSQ